MAAREAAVTSASQIGMPLARIDGEPGPVATELRREFYRFAEIGQPRLLPTCFQLGLASPCAGPSNGGRRMA